MSRYIDADYFARQIEDVIKSQRYDELVTCEKKFPTVADVLATVVDELKGKSLNGFEHCPPADVRENVRGEWIIRNVQDWKGRPTGKKFIKCDQCEEEEIISFGRSPFNFCPNCGADMKGETNG